MKAGAEFCGTPRLVQYFPGGSKEILCRCEYFLTQKIVISQRYSWVVSETSFQVILCLEGGGTLSCEHSEVTVRFSKGSCVFIPAGIGKSQLTGKAVLLLVSC